MLYSIILSVLNLVATHKHNRLPESFWEYEIITSGGLRATLVAGVDGVGGVVGRVWLGGVGMSIRLENLTVSYQHRPAVHHLEMTFAPASMWAVFGPNGAGKSTLLKAVMGLLKVDTGRVVWEGLRRRDIAYLPQQSEIDRSQPLSVFELAAMGLWYEIGFFGRVNGAQHARVEQALARVGMVEWAERPIAHLSNGQFQRVLFARMLTQNARYLLLDEPFNAVDAKTTYALLEVLNQCHREGRGVIAVLHDYEQVRAYFPNTLLMAREKIAAGKTETVLVDELLMRANAAMVQHDHDAWCETA